ncbi:hypothetical protein LINPERPRIM_LOCUS32733, partial [Linum perenne]
PILSLSWRQQRGLLGLIFNQKISPITSQKQVQKTDQESIHLDFESNRIFLPQKFEY